MSVRDIIVIGASAGGVEALSKLAGDLPPGFPATLLAVCHFPAGQQSVLPAILSRAGSLLAVHPRDGDPIHPGQIYVAPPDHHLLVHDGQIRLSRGPRENGHRPAIDPLFRSVANWYGGRVIGVVLSGAMHDGVAGLMAIRAAGGVAVVQDPLDAAIGALPKHAAGVAGADYTVPAAGLAELLVELVGRSGETKGANSMTDPIDKLAGVQVQDAQSQMNCDRRGELSVFTCPECGGALWQVNDHHLIAFRCHIGHAYHGETLLAEQTDILEAALWTAVRTFKDRAVLSRQLAQRERNAGDADAASRFDEQAQQAEQYGASIQEHLLSA
jgi:two-component system chemotaxis response regulator CheB